MTCSEYVDAAAARGAIVLDTCLGERIFDQMTLLMLHTELVQFINVLAALAGLLGLLYGLYELWQLNRASRHHNEGIEQ